MSTLPETHTMRTSRAQGLAHRQGRVQGRQPELRMHQRTEAFRNMPARPCGALPALEGRRGGPKAANRHAPPAEGQTASGPIIRT